MDFRTRTVSNKRCSIIFALPNTDPLVKSRLAQKTHPSPCDLKKRLNNLLKMRGKPIKTYNLKEFSVKHKTVTKK